MKEVKQGKYLTIDNFYTCSQIHHKYALQIKHFPENLAETLKALPALDLFTLASVLDSLSWDKL